MASSSTDPTGKGTSDKSKSDSGLQEEFLRYQRWERTVKKIESLGVYPKINLDKLNDQQTLWLKNEEAEKTKKELRRSMKLPQQQVLQPHTFRRLLSVEYDGKLDQNKRPKLSLDKFPKFRRISSFVGTEEGFALFEESALLGKSAGSFERTDSLMNPKVGAGIDGGMERTYSFKSARSGENGTLFDFSTTNTEQKNLILGALPILPPKPTKSEEESEEKEDKKSGEKEESAEGEDTEKNTKEKDDASQASKDDDTSGSKSTKSEKSGKEEQDSDGGTDQVISIEDENGQIRAYTRDEKKLILARYREKKRKRSFKKVIRYECRRKFAVSRPRVGGRFVKLNK